MAKKTTYQRLKEEKLELLSDIRALVKSPNHPDTRNIKLKYNFMFDKEDMMRMGSYKFEEVNNG